jgi:hypothetical protein
MAATNSPINQILGGTRGAPVPEVGMGATLLFWTDRQPATIIAVETFKTGQKAGQPKAVLAQDDAWKRVDDNGMSESQQYVFTPNPNGAVRRFTLRADGAYRCGSVQLAIGSRDRYYDFSF